MKKSFFTLVVGLVLGLSTNCSTKNVEKEKEDSINHENFIVAVEGVIHEVDQDRLDSIRKDSINNASICLTFQTFTSPKKMDLGNVTLQLFSPLKTIETNLASLGYELIDTKSFERNDYYDGSDEPTYVTAQIKIYNKIVNGQITLVSIESQNDSIIEISIIFPNTSYAEAFKKTVKGKLKDIQDNFWQLEVNYTGNKVIMKETEAC